MRPDVKLRGENFALNMSDICIYDVDRWIVDGHTYSSEEKEPLKISLLVIGSRFRDHAMIEKVEHGAAFVSSGVTDGRVDGQTGGRTVGQTDLT